MNIKSVEDNNQIVEAIIHDNKVIDNNGNQVAYFDEKLNLFVVSSEDADWWED